MSKTENILPLNRMLKIETGKFPWKLLYLGLAGLILAIGLYWSASGAGERPIGAEVPLGGSALCAWYAFLTFKSGVATSRFGATRSRTESPFVFWSEITLFSSFCFLLLTMAIFW